MRYPFPERSSPETGVSYHRNLFRISIVLTEAALSRANFLLFPAERALRPGGLSWTLGCQGVRMPSRIFAVLIFITLSRATMLLFLS